MIPLIFPLLCASLIKRLSASMTRINSNGDKGKLFLMPWEARKKIKGDPFTSSAKFANDRQPIIQLTPTSGIPI